MTRVLCPVLLFLGACSFEARVRGAAATEPDASQADARDPDAPATVAPWLPQWAHRKSITIRASHVAGALVDFPVSLTLADAEIAAGALASGNDIVFTGADAMTPLASEIETFSKTTTELVAWVKVPALSATTDTRLYIYYGNPSPPTRVATDVWTSQFLGVWHLQQDPGPGGNGDIRDATAGHHDGTPLANMQTQNLVAAEVGPGIYFDGTEDFINFNTADVGSSFTISMWIRYNDHASCNTLFANAASGRDTDGFRFFVNSANSSNRRLVFEAGNGNAGSGQIAETANNAIPLDTFTHVAAVVDRAAATAKLYVNGQMVATDTSIINDFKTNSDFEIGRMEDAFLFFQGDIDEVEVAKTQRSPEWIRTAYNNQFQPDTFYLLDGEETR